MTRSAYATTSALTVPCPACCATIALPCVSLSKNTQKRGKPRMKAHPARRSAADAKRTAEVHDFEIPPEIPLREPLPPRIPDLCPDDEYTGPDSSREREEFEIAAADDAIKTAHLAGAGNDDGPDIDFGSSHNPEACRDPACHCFPF